MKVSRAWLQTYFDTPLPTVEELSHAFTFHAFEVEAVDGEMLDLKVLPDRAGYGLSHRGIALELSAILDIPLKRDPLRESLPEWKVADALYITVAPEYVVRHVGALYRGVKVGPSPEWLKNALESVGQRSINNIVDATNYVMLDLGQPLHAFDAGKISRSGSVLNIDIRAAKDGEKVKILTGEELTLSKSMYVIANGASGEALDVAGIKGGLSTGVSDETTELFISCGNYDGTLIRRMAQSLKLFTDASTRFQNRPSPELAAHGMRNILQLLAEVAGGELVGVLDIYPSPKRLAPVSVSIAQIHARLGSTPSAGEIGNALSRLKIPFELASGVFVVTPPFERTDLALPEDVIEEVGRIIGYENLEPQYFSASAEALDQKRAHGIERLKDFLVERGFIEISTQSFAKKGDIGLANPLDDSNPFLRPQLAQNMLSALKQAKNYAPLVLPPNTKPKLFEIGNVFTKSGESLSLAVSETVEGLNTELGLTPVITEKVEEYDLGKFDLDTYGATFEPRRYAPGPFVPFSLYPFVLRDIAVWVPEGIESAMVFDTIRSNAGNLLYRIDLFDTFSKEGHVSYAYRLVFQSADKTLSDDEVNEIMKSVSDVLNAKEGWKVR